MMFNRECPRCAGTGRFDRGYCFQCKGARFVRQRSRPSLPAHVVEIVYENGSKNRVTMFFRQRAQAEATVLAECARKGWKATITPALFM